MTLFLTRLKICKRGTGILISCKLDFQILNKFSDAAENILGVHLTIHDHPLIFISIYGPNTVDVTFFADIRRCLQLNPDANIICGGDWNLTFSTADTENNIDIFRMASPPSLIRSRALADISNLYNLSDPFRALHPDRLDFSYRPRNGLPNRSRIDFFLISDSLLEHVSTCEIATEISTELFDHHCINLSFKINLLEQDKLLITLFSLTRGSWTSYRRRLRILTWPMPLTTTLEWTWTPVEERWVLSLHF